MQFKYDIAPCRCSKRHAHITTYIYYKLYITRYTHLKKSCSKACFSHNKRPSRLYCDIPATLYYNSVKIIFNQQRFIIADLFLPLENLN